MSISDAKTDDRPTGRLSVTAPLGVEIEIADGRFRQVYVGAAPASLTLPEGVYNLSWHAGGRSEDRMVRVRSDRPASEHGGEFPLGSAAPSAGKAASMMERSQFESVQKAVSLGGASQASEILVVVRSSNERPVADLARSIRLTDRRGERLRQTALSAANPDVADNLIATRRFVTDPGPHILGFEGSERRRLEQAVHAFEGRQTIVYLKYGSLMIAEKSPTGTGLKPRRGIDPTETTVVSVPLRQSAKTDLDEGGRLADIMLHKLAAGETLRDEALLDALKRRNADPYLRLYGAALLAADRSEQDQAQRRNDALRLLEQLDKADLPDAICIRWRLDRAELDRGRGLLVSPPLLDASWRWASEHSVLDPESIALGPVLSAAAKVTEPTPPWLVWLTAAKTTRRPEPASAETSAAQVAQLTRQIVTLVGSQLEQRLPTFLNRQLASLSPATVEFANAAISVLSGVHEPPDPEIARRIAYSTGTPSWELAPQLGEALEELKSAEAG